MIVPENKLCPMSFGDNAYNRGACLCLGEMCMWFDKDKGACLGARPKSEVLQVEPAAVETTTTKTRATSRKKDTATAQ